MIYVVQGLDGGPVKIGTTENFELRRKQLEATYRQPLAVLATMPGGTDEERAIHERFAEHRLGKTEQFRPVAEIMAFIGRPLLVCPDPDAVERIGGDLVSIKVDRKIVSRAKLVAARRGIPLSEFISDLLRGPTNRLFNEMLREVDKEANGS